jgi:pimeloyl-ACP methyl ester carboxylesterase
MPGGKESEQPARFLSAVDGAPLAYCQRRGRGPGVFFLGGFNSDMRGNKATALDRWCVSAGRAFTRFDYRGHGESGGRLVDGTIGGWLDDATRVLATAAEGPQLLVGSSLGGWLALLLARRRPERCAGLLLLAPAADFTERLLPRQLGAARLAQLAGEGACELPSDYPGERPYTIGRQLLEEGRSHCLLDGSTFPLPVPVRIIHGTADTSVPASESLALLDALAGDVALTLVKDADHRLSTSADTARMLRQLEELLAARQRPGGRGVPLRPGAR